MCAPEEDVELQPRKVEGEERDEREDELGQDGPRDLAEGPYLYDVCTVFSGFLDPPPPPPP